MWTVLCSAHNEWTIFFRNGRLWVRIIIICYNKKENGEEMQLLVTLLDCEGC